MLTYSTCTSGSFLFCLCARISAVSFCFISDLNMLTDSTCTSRSFLFCLCAKISAVAFCFISDLNMNLLDLYIRIFPLLSVCEDCSSSFLFHLLRLFLCSVLLRLLFLLLSLLILRLLNINWAWSCKNVSHAICEQQRHRSACASAQSDQHLCHSLLR